VFTIMIQIVPQQQRKLQQILFGIEKVIENIEFIENAEVTENFEDMQVSEE
ncbi:3940_t:CDS:2, partial [Gigaspora rosea]